MEVFISNQNSKLKWNYWWRLQSKLVFFIFYCTFWGGRVHKLLPSLFLKLKDLIVFISEHPAPALQWSCLHPTTPLPPTTTSPGMASPTSGGMLRTMFHLSALGSGIQTTVPSPGNLVETPRTSSQRTNGWISCATVINQQVCTEMYLYVCCVHVPTWLILVQRFACHSESI